MISIRWVSNSKDDTERAVKSLEVVKKIGIRINVKQTKIIELLNNEADTSSNSED